MENTVETLDNTQNETDLREQKHDLMSSIVAFVLVALVFYFILKFIIIYWDYSLIVKVIGYFVLVFYFLPLLLIIAVKVCRAYKVKKGKNKVSGPEIGEMKISLYNKFLIMILWFTLTYWIGNLMFNNWYNGNSFLVSTGMILFQLMLKSFNSVQVFFKLLKEIVK